MANDVINFAEKYALFAEHWKPKVIAEMNDYQFKIAKIHGEFIWHSHADTDEVFFVMDGKIDIAMRDRTVTINTGEMFVVPKGVEHKPIAEEEAQILLIEPRGVVNTGDEKSDLRAENDVWI